MQRQYGNNPHYNPNHRQHGNNPHHRQPARFSAEEPVAVSWSTVVGWIGKNPHASTPPPISTESTIECISIPIESVETWTQMSVEPSTPLSCMLSALDAEGFNASTGAIRRAVLRETCTNLQIRAETELKGREHPKAKTNVGIVEVSEKEHSPWCPYGLSAIAALYKVQMVILNETDKKLSFVPEDVAIWDKETPIYYFAHNYRSVYVAPRGFGADSILDWMVEKEIAGWTWSFKEVKGTIDEIREFCAGRGIELPVGKVKKDILVEKASKGAVYNLFLSWKNI